MSVVIWWKLISILQLGLILKWTPSNCHPAKSCCESEGDCGRSDSGCILSCIYSTLDIFTSLVFQICKPFQYVDPSCKHLFSFVNWSLSLKPLLQEFPVYPQTSNDIHLVKNALFTQSSPEPFANSNSIQLIAWSDHVIRHILDLDPMAAVSDQSFVKFVSGSVVHPSSRPLAHRYGGHQFGIWAGQLGDGRAHWLGEYVSVNTGKRWELQLKGSGKTPFSRDGDGRAVLRSSIREFLASEAMYHLGIPTSRAATLVVSADKVKRDPFYNGQVRSEPTAVVLRIAQSWFRFGSFEVLANAMELDLLRQLTNFIIRTHYTDIDNFTANRYAAFFKAVLQRTAHTTSLWHGVGFVHGVLNTDNMSILGLTIDYGPFRFVDEYDPDLVSNGSDDEGRYRLSRQPLAVKENLAYLFTALSKIMSHDELSEASSSLREFMKIYRAERTSTFMKKIGLANAIVNDGDEELIDLLLEMISDQRSDFTATFRQMSELSVRQLVLMAGSTTAKGPQWAVHQLAKHRNFNRWIFLYRDRLLRANISDCERRKIMQRTNPRYVLRNWMAEDAIQKAENGDFTRLKILLRILGDPFMYQWEAEYLGYADRPPTWASNITLTCSS